MQTTITFKLPYPFRHLLPEIKARGGRFDSMSKTWSLEDTFDNRELARQLATPPPIQTATPDERVRGVAAVALELLNGLQIGHFTLCATTVDRVVIEKITA